MKVDPKTADTLGWFTAIVKRPFHAEWSNYGMPDLATDYKAGEKIRCFAWKPEGMSPCKAAGHPDMWLSWKLLDNCEYSAEDVARLERLTAENSRARNANFKVGEYVTSKERPYLGKGRIIDEVDFNQYIVKFGGGAQDLFEGSDLVAANACAKNACGIRSTNAAVNAALNACKAKNAVEDHKSKKFGRIEVSTWVYQGKDASDFMYGIPMNEPSGAKGEPFSREYTISKAKARLERAKQDVKDITAAIAWLEQNAK